MPENAGSPGGVALLHNPGATALYTTYHYHWTPDGHGGRIIRMGDALNVVWYAKGKLATRAEALEAMNKGLPQLERMCGSDEERAELGRYVERAQALLPAV